MRRSPYYSVRSGVHPTGGRLNLSMLQQLFVDLYREFAQKGFFQQAFGYECVDAGEVDGYVGPFIDRYVFRKLKKDHLWPIGVNQSHLSEDDIFDLIEFLFDHVSKGVSGAFHQYNDCGWHYRQFDQEQGRLDFATAISDVLREYEGGFALTHRGEVVTLAPRGLATLEDGRLPAGDVENVRQRVDAAVHKFRRRGATTSDRRDAIRDLVDVLEYLRADAKKLLTRRDEADLFEIANSFGIRHHNTEQKTGYDPDVWFSWMFYYYLATIRALAHLIARNKK